jgi:hypothetical protein
MLISRLSSSAPNKRRPDGYVHRSKVDLTVFASGRRVRSLHGGSRTSGHQ